MFEILEKQTLSSGRSLEICHGDITTVSVDAIVNAANSQLAHGGGVAAAISRQGGSAIQQESTAWVKKHGPVSHHKPAFTTGGLLPCRYVIHAVGPIWGSGDEKNKLKTAITGSLETAGELNLASIAFPAISTGIYRFPVDLAAEIFMRTIPQYFSKQSESPLKSVKIVLYSEDTLKVFLNEFSKTIKRDLT